MKKVGTLIKAIPIKRKITGDTIYDSILLIFRDENGQKQIKFISRAEAPFYILKDRESPEAYAPPMFIEKDKVREVHAYSDTLLRTIAEKTDCLAFYENPSADPNKQVLDKYSYQQNLKNLLKHDLIYSADMDVTDRAIKNFFEEYEPDMTYKLHKCYFDIEVDTMANNYNSFPDEEIAPSPVNIITLTDEKNEAVYTFVYEDSRNESLKAFHRDWENNEKALSDAIRLKIKERNNIEISAININFFNSELETITAFFKKVHEIDPDVMCAWNMVFDVKTLLNRLEKLFHEKASKSRGAPFNAYNQMLEVVADSKYAYIPNEEKPQNSVFISPFAKYTSHKEKTIVDRMDEFSVLDGIMWHDQMLLYANIRKSSGMKESYSLDAIAGEELGSEKLDYTGYTIQNLPWKNFKLFTEYNIVDTVLLAALERKLLDVDMVRLFRI